MRLPQILFPVIIPKQWKHPISSCVRSPCNANFRVSLQTLVIPAPLYVHCTHTLLTHLSRLFCGKQNPAVLQAVLSAQWCNTQETRSTDNSFLPRKRGLSTFPNSLQSIWEECGLTKKSNSVTSQPTHKKLASLLEEEHDIQLIINLHVSCARSVHHRLGYSESHTLEQCLFLQWKQ